MATLPPQPVSITCPNCKTNFQTQVHFIDVGQQPELKQALLSGQINLAVCPNCRAGGLLATPLVYHDPEKQLFFALFPQEIAAKPEEQERFIGALQQFAIQSLPADKPKGYLLNPRRFITLTSMLDEILEAEGIPKQALQAQRKRSELLARLLQAEADEEAFKRLVQENKDAIDYEFFITLSAYIEAATAERDQESAQHFTALRDRLLELTGLDQAAVTNEAGEPDLQTVVDAFLSVEEADLEKLIGEHRLALDYDFYAALTNRADAARAANDETEAQRIEARRAAILETSERMDREAQALFENATKILSEVLQASDLRQALTEWREHLNEAFMLVVSANREAAQRAQQTELVERLNQIEQLTMEVIQESLSPEERFIGQLLSVETPQAATKLLRQNAAQITPDLVKRINELADELSQNGRPEVGERLRQLGREAASMLF
jgi:hypothetical protein